MGSVGSDTTTYTTPQKQREWEERYRHSEVEHGAYFDKDGNVLVEGVGNNEKIDFDAIEINHEVEQRVWNDEEVNFSHNHPYNAIFSPEDVESFEDMENHSMTATLPNGTDYVLIREQPRTSNELRWNEEKQDFVRDFEPKKIASAYRDEYSKVFDPLWDKVKSTTKYGTAEREAAEAKMDAQVASHMESWLNKHASSYGYKFVKSQ